MTTSIHIQLAHKAVIQKFYEISLQRVQALK